MHSFFPIFVSHQLAARIPALPPFIRFDSAAQSLTHTVQKKSSSINSTATRFCRFYHAPPSHSRVDFFTIFHQPLANIWFIRITKYWIFHWPTFVPLLSRLHLFSAKNMLHTAVKSDAEKIDVGWKVRWKFNFNSTDQVHGRGQQVSALVN